MGISGFPGRAMLASIESSWAKRFPENEEPCETRVVGGPGRRRKKVRVPR
jgi:hypothetical protein